MAALADDRNTKEMAAPWAMCFDIVGIDSDEFYKGALLAYDQSDSKIKPGAAATDLIAVGRCEQRVSTGASNTKTVRVKSGIFKWANSGGGDAIAADDVGKDCYIVDDQTVGLTDGTGSRSKAGKIVQVDSDGVWVATFFPGV